jgi:hypothetical protein
MQSIKPVQFGFDSRFHEKTFNSTQIFLKKNTGLCKSTSENTLTFDVVMLEFVLQKVTLPVEINEGQFVVGTLESVGETCVLGQ